MGKLIDRPALFVIVALTLWLTPTIASAQTCNDPGVCYIGGSCSTQCTVCRGFYPDGSCIVTRQTTCGAASACGGCRTLNQWTEVVNSNYHNSSPGLTGCRRPNDERYILRAFTQTTTVYRTTECDGGQSTSIISQSTQQQSCWLRIDNFCGQNDVTLPDTPTDSCA
jgi:hypothetical protein